jgi:hypothetical protein
MLGGFIEQIYLLQQSGNKLDLLGVQAVRWDKGGTVRVVDYSYFYGKGN